jgi:hypothetical protein
MTYSFLCVYYQYQSFSFVIHTDFCNSKWRCDPHTRSRVALTASYLPSMYAVGDAVNTTIVSILQFGNPFLCIVYTNSVFRSATSVHMGQTWNFCTTALFAVVNSVNMFQTEFAGTFTIHLYTPFSHNQLQLFVINSSPNWKLNINFVQWTQNCSYP